METTGKLSVTKPRQFGTFADACNECGNCDVMCPEEGGPYRTKPLFFGSVRTWREAADHDGFAFEPTAAGLRMHGRIEGREVTVDSGNGLLRYQGEGFDLRLDLADPAGTATGHATGAVDLLPARIMEQLRQAVTGPKAANFVTAILERARE
jgi:putative selenate reductase